MSRLRDQEFPMFILKIFCSDIDFQDSTIENGSDSENATSPQKLKHKLSNQVGSSVAFIC